MGLLNKETTSGRWGYKVAICIVMVLLAAGLTLRITPQNSLMKLSTFGVEVEIKR